MDESKVFCSAALFSHEAFKIGNQKIGKKNWKITENLRRAPELLRVTNNWGYHSNGAPSNRYHGNRWDPQRKLSEILTDSLTETKKKKRKKNRKKNSLSILPPILNEISILKKLLWNRSGIALKMRIPGRLLLWEGREQNGGLMKTSRRCKEKKINWF